MYLFSQILYISECIQIHQFLPFLHLFKDATWVVGTNHFTFLSEPWCGVAIVMAISNMGNVKFGLVDLYLV
jgi:hypothetical protein